MDRIDEDHQLVVNSLREAGIQVSDVYEFVNGATPREAIPVLIQVLPLLGDNTIKEGVVRALGDKSARGIAAQPLLDELKRLGGTKPLLAWAVANSLAEVSERSDYDQLRSLARDRSLGKAREMLVIALARTKHPDAAAELENLASDEALAGHVVMAAGELGANRLRPFVERQLQSQTAWVRKEAKKALRRLE
jgi:HEAT repeat protein